VQRRLPCWRLTEPRRHDVAHDAFFDDAWVDARPPDRFTNDHRAELRCGERLERT
jgi:hypothetical protein